MVIKKSVRFSLLGAFLLRSIMVCKHIFYYAKYRIGSMISLNLSMKYLTQDLNMTRIIYIKLDALTHYLTKSTDSKELLHGKHFFSVNFIQRGEWDTYINPILPDYYNQEDKRAVTFRSTYQIFKDGIPYWECDEYKRKIKGESGYDQASAAELVKKYKDLEILFNNIKTKGYKSQRELKKIPKRWQDEIRVAIDRNGMFIKIAESGNHRLAIAQILNIEHIPVYIQGVHQHWALSCYSMHGGHLLYAINKELSLMNQNNRGE